MGESNTLETALRELNKDPERKTAIEPISWWKDAGTSFILRNIIRNTKICDFACIIFTKPAPDDSHGQRLNYNVIYEAGLFAGAFGPEPERCFILSPFSTAELPSDLWGLRYFSLSDGDTKVADIEEAAKKIGEAIDRWRDRDLRAKRGLKQDLITWKELMSSGSDEGARW